MVDAAGTRQFLLLWVLGSYRDRELLLRLQDAKTYTWFGEAEQEITGSLRASVGLNVARDEKDVKIAAIAPTPDNQHCDVSNGTCNYGFSDHLNNTSYLPKASITYNWTDETMASRQGDPYPAVATAGLFV